MIDELIFPECSRYFQHNIESLKYKFPGIEKIKNNYSQAFQDMFVLTMLNGKTGGTYVEIGGDHGIIISNTYLLEEEFGWSGVAFEIEEDRAKGYNELRNNECICTDALAVNFSEVFSGKGFSDQIDYLQLDIDPASQTLKCLKNIPLDEYRFSVITFETDIYRDGADIAEESRKIFLDHGYELIAKNVSNRGVPFEDWYVDPTVVDLDLIKQFKNDSQLNIDCDKILFGE
jgi:hypothetical protein